MINKMIKTKSEGLLMQKAADLAVDCMKYIQKEIVLNVPELTLKRKIIKWFNNHGAKELSFDPIVAFGANAANPHHKPNWTRLTKNDAIVIDIGCKWQGWCSDITRTFLPAKPSKKQLEVYDIVLQANLKGIKAAKPNMKAQTLDKVCRDFISKKCYGKYFIHTTGHAIGKEVHEMPRIGPKDETILKNNMFFTIEPGIYIPGQLGIRIEDTVTLVNNKVKVLTKKADKLFCKW